MIALGLARLAVNLEITATRISVFKHWYNKSSSSCCQTAKRTTPSAHWVPHGFHLKTSVILAFFWSLRNALVEHCTSTHFYVVSLPWTFAIQFGQMLLLSKADDSFVACDWICWSYTVELKINGFPFDFFFVKIRIIGLTAFLRYKARGLQSTQEESTAKGCHIGSFIWTTSRLIKYVRASLSKLFLLFITCIL